MAQEECTKHTWHEKSFVVYLKFTIKCGIFFFTKLAAFLCEKNGLYGIYFSK